MALAGALLAVACGPAPAPASPRAPPPPRTVARTERQPPSLDACSRAPGATLDELLSQCDRMELGNVGDIAAAIEAARHTLDQVPDEDEAGWRAAWRGIERAHTRALCAARDSAAQVEPLRRIVHAKEAGGDGAGAAALAADVLDRWGSDSAHREEVLVTAYGIDWIPYPQNGPWPDGLDGCASRVGEGVSRDLADRCAPGDGPLLRLPRERVEECSVLRRFVCELARREAQVLSMQSRHAEASRAYEALAFGGDPRCAAMSEHAAMWGRFAAFEARDAGDEERAAELFRRVAETYPEPQPQTVCGWACGPHHPW